MTNKSKATQKLFKAALATSLAAGTVVAIVPANSEAATTSFKDVNAKSPYYSSVLNLSKRDIISGFPDGTYRPDVSVTRGQAAKIIALTIGAETKNVKDPGFSDINKSHQFYGPVAALVNAGILSGFEDSTFRPDETLTRSQMAKVIALAFGLPEETYANRFTDVSQSQWFKGYVQTLIDNNVTKGSSAKTFSPYSPVKRGDLASFVVRAEAAKAALNKAETVTSVTNDSITLSSGTYTISPELKKVLNATNATALKGAKIKFTATNGVIVKVESIEITAKGTATNNVVLDGAGASIAADVKVSGDYVTLKNLTIKGDLIIGNELGNYFLGDNIVVEGKTVISDKAAAVTTAAIGDGAQIIFTNSTLGAVSVAEADTTINFTGTTTVTSIVLTSNTTVNADAGIVIPTITVSEDATQIVINATVTNLIVSTITPVAIEGNADITNATVTTTFLVSFEINGEITTLQVTVAGASVELGTNTEVGNLVLPAGTEASDVIENYDEVSDNIAEIDGEPNPDATPPGGGGGPSLTPEQAFEASIQFALNNNLSGANSTINATFNAGTDTIAVSITDGTKQVSDLVATGIFNTFDSSSLTSVKHGTEELKGKNIQQIVNHLLTALAVTPSTPLALLNGKTITFDVVGNGFTDTYTFNFTLQP